MKPITDCKQQEQDYRQKRSACNVSYRHKRSWPKLASDLANLLFLLHLHHCAIQQYYRVLLLLTAWYSMGLQQIFIDGTCDSQNNTSVTSQYYLNSSKIFCEEEDLSLILAQLLNRGCQNSDSFYYYTISTYLLIQEFSYYQYLLTYFYSKAYIFQIFQPTPGKVMVS